MEINVISMLAERDIALEWIDYLAFAAYFVVLCGIGLWVGRKEKTQSDDYFLAGRSLPWYVVGSSFIASNISTEHFIGMIGAAFIYGICVAMQEWANVATFTILIWVFIPFLLSSRVFTTPEFMERRFHPSLRYFFAIVTVISNVVAFLAAVLYGGGLALNKLFSHVVEHLTRPLAEMVHGQAVAQSLLNQWNLWFCIVVLGVVAGAWAIYGGLKSVAWTDFFTVIVMIAGGLTVTILGLRMLAGEGGSIVDGWHVMIERNQAEEGVWAEAVQKNIPNMAPGEESYNRLSVIQPMTHTTTPWAGLIMLILSVSIWYNVINQFMIQRVLGAKNMYHARMGIVLAGYMKILMPLIVVIPGLIFFAWRPEGLLQAWQDVPVEADQGYVTLLKELIPAGLTGLFLAALFGAIQSTVNSVLNSTATIFTLDLYKRLLRPGSSERHLVVMGMLSSIVILIISIVLAGFISRFEGGNLFVYIQALYAFFAPPFSAVFLLGILFRRINGPGAVTAVVAGFVLGIGVKIYLSAAGGSPATADALHNMVLGGAGEFLNVPLLWLWHAHLLHIPILDPFANQAALNWVFCAVVCVVVSLMTPRPEPEQVTDQLTINWRKLNIFNELGGRWYTSVVLWWALFAAIVTGLMVAFSGAWL